MVIVSLNMGNLNLEVSSLKNILVMEKKEKAILHEELDINNILNYTIYIYSKKY
jgi:hypothetical protein